MLFTEEEKLYGSLSRRSVQLSDMKRGGWKKRWKLLAHVNKVHPDSDRKSPSTVGGRGDAVNKASDTFLVHETKEGRRRRCAVRERERALRQTQVATTPLACMHPYLASTIDASKSLQVAFLIFDSGVENKDGPRPGHAMPILFPLTPWSGGGAGYPLHCGWRIRNIHHHVLNQD